MNRIGIVFYSRSGWPRRDRLAELTRWPVHEVRDAAPRIGLYGDLRCIVDSVFSASRPSAMPGRPWTPTTTSS